MQQSSTPYPKVTDQLVAAVEKDPSLPSPAEQANNLILWMGDELTAREGESLKIDHNRHIARVGGSSSASLWFLLTELGRKNLVLNKGSSAESVASLTLGGWTRYEELKRGKVYSRRAFMAMEFGDATLDRVFGECFKPAVALTGFALERIDTRPEAGSIPNRMRVEILRSRFVIVDLTKNNPGAYWEAGYAEGLGRPVIYTCEKSFFATEGTHFDVTTQQHVLWDQSVLHDAADQLKLCIRVTLPGEAALEDRESS